LTLALPWGALTFFSVNYAYIIFSAPPRTPTAPLGYAYAEMLLMMNPAAAATHLFRCRQRLPRHPWIWPNWPSLADSDD